MGDPDPREDPPDMDAVPGLLQEGADDYNAGRFWEAHEAWEEAWHALRAAGRTEEAEFLQGAILVAAAFENATREKPLGFRRQGAQALRQLRANPGAGDHLGLADEEAWVEAVLAIYLEACSAHRFAAWLATDWEAPPLRLDV
jgi:predicted metal-dependent hydrolase